MTLPETILEVGGRRVIAVGDREGARAIVVLSHGFQMEPADLSPFAHSLGLPAWFLFPEAPRVALPRGRAWWHIDPELRDEAIARGPRDFAVQYPPDLADARAALGAFLDEVIADSGGRPVVVGGFSQGAMLTCDTLLRSPRPVAGVALLSASRLAFDEWRPFLAAGNVRGLPMLVSHGTADPDLAFSAGTALKDCLVEAGADVTWVPFEQGHEIPLVVWRRLRKFVERVAP
ncbi:MAG: putative Carboxylesterase [Labilithrix sp.]|nr:putative Carboxylesterase [Labilithrix sp.]